MLTLQKQGFTRTGEIRMSLTERREDGFINLLLPFTPAAIERSNNTQTHPRDLFKVLTAQQIHEVVSADDDTIWMLGDAVLQTGMSMDFISVKFFTQPKVKTPAEYRHFDVVIPKRSSVFKSKYRWFAFPDEGSYKTQLRLTPGVVPMLVVRWLANNDIPHMLGVFIRNSPASAMFPDFLPEVTTHDSIVKFTQLTTDHPSALKHITEEII